MTDLERCWQDILKHLPEPHPGSTYEAELYHMEEAIKSCAAPEGEFAWKPVSSVEQRQVSWIDDQSRHVAVVLPGPRYYLLDLPPLPQEGR